MKKLITIIATIAALTAARQVMAQYYVAGTFNGWNVAGNVMTQTSPGIWQVSLTGLTPEAQQFRITDGTNWLYPASGGNSWFWEDNTGNVTITFNTNVESDGGMPAQYRIGVSSDGWAPQMYLPGDFNGWNTTGNPMTYEGGGIYEETLTLAAGTYNFKALAAVGNGSDGISWDSGDWYAYGGDGADTWSANLSLTSDGVDPLLIDVNEDFGVVTVTTIPEPSSIALVLAGLLGAFVIRRKH
jgi:hypothetical protein